jgi:predicted outer membrane protein
MIRLRSVLTVAVAAALAVPAAASADPNPTRVSLAPQATYVSSRQINVEVGLACAEGSPTT